MNIVYRQAPKAWSNDEIYLLNWVIIMYSSEHNKGVFLFVYFIENRRQTVIGLKLVISFQGEQQMNAKGITKFI